MTQIRKVITVFGLAIACTLAYFYYATLNEPTSLSGQVDPSTNSESNSQSEVARNVAVLVASETKITHQINEKNKSKVDNLPRGSAKDLARILPTEETLMSKHGATFDMKEINSVLSTDSYYEKFRSLQEEQFGNADATQLTSEYVDLFENFPMSTDSAELKLNELSCGLTICMGSVQTFDNGQTWKQFVMGYLGGQEVRVLGAMTSYPFQLDEDTLEQRFIFSMNPEDNILMATIEDGTEIYSGDLSEDTPPPNDGDTDG